MRRTPTPASLRGISSCHTSGVWSVRNLPPQSPIHCINIISYLFPFVKNIFVFYLPFPFLFPDFHKCNHGILKSGVVRDGYKPKCKTEIFVFAMDVFQDNCSIGARILQDIIRFFNYFPDINTIFFIYAGMMCLYVGNSLLCQNHLFRTDRIGDTGIYGTVNPCDAFQILFLHLISYLCISAATLQALL